MARSFSGMKMVANLVSKHTSPAPTSSRGFAALAQGVAGSGKSVKPVMEKEGAAAAVPWIPDPVTGCYRPENAADDIDVAELREMLQKQNKNRKK